MRAEPTITDISFQVGTHLRQQAIPFQHLQVWGTFRIKRTPESQEPPQFANCDFEFTDLSITPSKATKGHPSYQPFQLDIDIDLKQRHAFPSNTGPFSTPKYKVSNESNKPKPVTIGASASHMAEQSSAEKTAYVSRIIRFGSGPLHSWTFHIVDPHDQLTAFRLPPENCPFIHIKFLGNTMNTPPAPPPQYLKVEISVYLRPLSPPGDNAWLSLWRRPKFANLCQVITLDVPSDLQGSHVYETDIEVWPKLSELPFMSTTTRRSEPPFAVTVVETDHTIDTT